MRRFITTCLMLLLLSVPITAYATPIGETEGGDNGTDSGGGGGGGGDGEGPYVPVVPQLPNELLVTPKVTALHSINALLDSDGASVYFIPSLEDFPTSLKDTASLVTDYNNVEHRFAVVYDGYFNSEVEYVAATNNSDSGAVARLQTSKKVYSSTDNTRTLNLLGYDLLLTNEQCSIQTNGANVSATYHPTLVGAGALDAQTVVMDLYKALNEYEWDIRFTWVKDDDLLLQTSPIQSEIGVALSDRTDTGIDTSEGATYVWATRTNPNLYWDKVKHDAVFDGGAHTVTSSDTSSFVGCDTSVSFSKSQGDTVTFGEFCAIARAMMDLYGEPVMTEREALIMIQNYGTSLPDCNNTEVYESVCYLAAKGIIDPTEYDLDSNVTFADIDPILIRIADPDSRLTFKQLVFNEQSTLFKNGYVKTDIAVNNGEVSEVDVVNSDTTTMYNDYLVECDDDMTNFILTGHNGEKILAADNIKCNGYSSAQITDSVSPDASIDTAYPFEFLGIKDNFYHFKIATYISDITISYERSAYYSGCALNRSNYRLPNSAGGVYLVENGGWKYYNFDNAAGKVYTVLENDHYVEHQLPEYSAYYTDNVRRHSSELLEMTNFGFMSNYNWIYFKMDDNAYNDLDNYWYGSVCLSDLKTMSNGSTMQLAYENSYIWVKYLLKSTAGSNQHVFIFQVTCGLDEFRRNLSYVGNNAGRTSTYSDNAFFRPEDNSVLVSIDFLKRSGLISSYSELSGGTGILLYLPNMQTNVIIREDLNLVIVGDTMYKAKGDVVSYKDSSGKLYVNYRACIGWTYDYLILNGSQGIQVSVPSNNRISSIQRSNKSIHTFYPASDYGISTLQTGGKTYIPLSATNALGNYLLVVDEDTGDDWLFMWKHKRYALPNDSTVQSGGDDADARNKFTELTGISLGASEYYNLTCTSLFHTNVTRSLGSDGFTWLTWSQRDASGVTRTNVIGWLYYVPTYGAMDTAFTKYLNTNSAAMLPVAKVAASWVNLNINMCSVDTTSDILPYGQMPKKYVERLRFANIDEMIAESNKMYKIHTPTQYAETSAQYDSLSNCVIYPAPVGQFNLIKGLPTATIGVASSGGRTSYYGSQKLTPLHHGTTYHYVIGPNSLYVDGGDTCTPLYLGNGATGIYAYGDTAMGVNVDIDEGLSSSINLVVTEPNKIIDWDKFKFSRLVTQLDKFSSILLIFALNVLPRIAMGLFFVLMILSLVKDWRAWQKFCDNYFDIYSFLTRGHLNVHNINVGRVVLFSMIALSIFFMIMDGLLFNFILWVAEFILTAMQR